MQIRLNASLNVVDQTQKAEGYRSAFAAPLRLPEGGCYKNSRKRKPFEEGNPCTLRPGVVAQPFERKPRTLDGLQSHFAGCFLTIGEDWRQSKT
jgi:hypothetical protein